MTVTLPPDLSDLLAKTGQRWPDADEDQLIAMADGWKGLQDKLSTMRVSNSDSARAVLAANEGEAMAAFGGWAKALDGTLLKLVELCARAEAVLIAVARAVLAAKKAILGALAWLARAVAAAKVGAQHIPVIGGLISDLIDQVVEPLFAAARKLITTVVTTISDLIVDTIVPAVVKLVRTVKNLIEDLRKRVTKRTGQQDWPTNPSGSPNPANRPTGPPETWTGRDDEDTIRGRRLENEAALTLAQAGYNGQQLRKQRNRKNPDFRLEGKIFDCTSPITGNARSIWSNIKKEKVDEGQTDRVVINIDAPDAKVSVDALRTQFQDYPMPGLKEVKVIAKGGAIIDIYP